MLPTLMKNPPRLSPNLATRHAKASKMIAKKSNPGGVI